MSGALTSEAAVSLTCPICEGTEFRGEAPKLVCRNCGVPLADTLAGSWRQFTDAFYRALPFGRVLGWLKAVDSNWRNEEVRALVRRGRLLEAQRLMLQEPPAPEVVEGEGKRR